MKSPILILSFACIFVLFGTAFSEADVKVLVFDTNGSGGGGIDFDPLTTIKKVRDEKMSYKKVDNSKALADAKLTDYDIVHLGFCSANRDGNYHIEAAEENIKNYVKGGGLVSVTSQDDNGFQSGWLPFELKSCEASDHLFEPTKEAGDLFTTPNEINPNTGVVLDDNWCQIDKHFVVLAYQNGSKNIADFLLLEHGKGIYLLSTLDTRNQGNASTNTPMLENMMNFLLEHRATGVSTHGKLTTTWASIKKL